LDEGRPSPQDQAVSLRLSGYGFETYTPEVVGREAHYSERVRAIGESGILAVNFVSHLHFPSQYIAPMCEWMDRHRIELSPRNYYPFYFVYALLLGPEAAAFYAGRRVLVVTSDEDGTKAPAIARTLRQLGAAEVHFDRSRAASRCSTRLM
jgi:hypothetical protein